MGSYANIYNLLVIRVFLHYSYCYFYERIFYNLLNFDLDYRLGIFSNRAIYLHLKVVSLFHFVKRRF